MTAFSSATTSRRTPKPRRRMSNERIDDELAGSVIGHLAAAVDLHHGDVARRQQVFTARIQPQGEHRRMFDEPDFVAGVRGALIREPLQSRAHVAS